jgi:hypothetical protein
MSEPVHVPEPFEPGAATMLAPLVSQHGERWIPRPDPRASTRIVDAGAGREKLREEGCCRICDRRPTGHPLDALNRMHIVPRGQGGDDVDDNIVPGCGSGATGCHGLLTSACEDSHHPAGLTVAEARARMNERLTDRERAYADRKKYPGWIDDNYPRRNDA